MTFNVLTVEVKVFYLFFLAEHFKVVGVPRTWWQNAKIVLFFKLKHMLEESHKFHFTMVGLASKLAKTRFE